MMQRPTCWHSRQTSAAPAVKALHRACAQLTKRPHQSQKDCCGLWLKQQRQSCLQVSRQAFSCIICFFDLVTRTTEVLYTLPCKLRPKSLKLMVINPCMCQAYLPCPVQMLVLPYHRPPCSIRFLCLLSVLSVCACSLCLLSRQLMFCNMYSKQMSTDSMFVARSRSADL